MADGADIAAVTTGFCARLRQAGLGVSMGQVVRFSQAVLLLEPSTIDDLYWCARATLLTNHEDLYIFDAVFSGIFGGLGDLAGYRGQYRHRTVGSSLERASYGSRPPRMETALFGGVQSSLAGSAARRGDSSEQSDTYCVASLASYEEKLASRDFSELTAEDQVAIISLMTRMIVSLPSRSSRRNRPSPRGEQVDMRATLRQSRRSGGDPLRRLMRHRQLRPRRLVLLLDVSGSMEPYAQAYLQFLQCASSMAKAEVFAFATRLTRLTAVMKQSRGPHSLGDAGKAVQDWSSGTRIGPAIKAFLDEHGRRGMARGAVVMIVSDGWECGDTSVLRAQMERLARLAHLVIWVNPRKAQEGYRPLASGMAAALPHCDMFFSGHNLDALYEVVRAMRA